MKNIFIGTGIMILAAIAALVLKLTGLNHNEIGFYVTLGVFAMGLVIQWIGIFSIKPPSIF